MLPKPPQKFNAFAVLSGGAVIGTLGGLIGLGGAEFRLPLLIGLFGFGALEAVILNKAMSLVVVATALPFSHCRCAIQYGARTVEHHCDIALRERGRCMVRSRTGHNATQRLYKVLAVLLVGIAGVLIVGHGAPSPPLPLEGWALTLAGVLAGVGIGIVAALLGVAGGELLIPTIALLFGADLKLAGSLSLAVSLPTMVTGFTRYSRDQSFQVIRFQWRFITIMAAGSMVGTFLGGKLLGVVPTPLLLPLLAAILLASAVVVRFGGTRRHAPKPNNGLASHCLQRPLRSRCRQQLKADDGQRRSWGVAYGPRSAPAAPSGHAASHQEPRGAAVLPQRRVAVRHDDRRAVPHAP